MTTSKKDFFSKNYIWLIIVTILCILTLLSSYFFLLKKPIKTSSDLNKTIGITDQKISLNISYEDELGQFKFPNQTKPFNIKINGKPESILALNQEFAVNSKQVLVLEAEGYFTEFVITNKVDTSANIKFLRKTENRFSMHNAGDVMLSRRYLDTTQKDESGKNTENQTQPLIRKDFMIEDSKQIVAGVKEIYSQADFATVNLESVISDSDGVSKKAYPIKSPTKTLEAIKEIGVDLVTLGNNHINDFGKTGLQDTVKALDENQIKFSGICLENKQNCTNATQTQINNQKFTTFSYNTVDGSFVNDNLPASIGNLKNDDLKVDWALTERSWGFDNQEISLSTQQRLPGLAWKEYRKIFDNKSISDQTKDQVYASLLVVYPELELWSSTNSHGGAAPWQSSVASKQISEKKKTGDIIAVQFHSGVRFESIATENLKNASRKAIDAGADIVISHHSHVVGGIEYYKGKPIIYSLGNFIFDQDFLDTKPSYFLRTIWEKDKILKSSAIPIYINDYKPQIVNGDEAKNIFERIIQASYNSHNASLARDEQGETTKKSKNPSKNSKLPNFVIENGIMSFGLDLQSNLDIKKASNQKNQVTKNLLLINPIENIGVLQTQPKFTDLQVSGNYEIETINNQQVLSFKKKSFSNQELELEISSLVDFDNYKDSKYILELTGLLEGKDAIIETDIDLYETVVNDPILKPTYNKVQEIQKTSTLKKLGQKNKTENFEIDLGKIENPKINSMKIKFKIRGVSQESTNLILENIKLKQEVKSSLLDSEDLYFADINL